MSKMCDWYRNDSCNCLCDGLNVNCRNYNGDLSLEFQQGKIYYPIEDAINKISEKFSLGLKDANYMDEIELNNAEKEICKYVEFVEHPDYIQLVPRIIQTGNFIL